MTVKRDSTYIHTETTRRDDGKFIRLAIIVPVETTESIDVVDSVGKLLMRLNISNHNDHLQSIDVIGSPQFSELDTYHVHAWLDGVMILSETRMAPLINVSIDH